MDIDIKTKFNIGETVYYNNHRFTIRNITFLTDKKEYLTVYDITNHNIIKYWLKAEDVNVSDTSAIENELMSIKEYQEFNFNNLDDTSLNIIGHLVIEYEKRNIESVSLSEYIKKSFKRY